MLLRLKILAGVYPGVEKLSKFSPTIAFLCIGLTLQNDLGYMDFVLEKRRHRIDKRKATNMELAYKSQSHSSQQGLCGEGWTGLVWTESDWENTKHLPGQLR